MAHPPRKPKFYQVWIDWIFTYLFAPAFAVFLHVLAWTYRWEIRGRENLGPFWDEGKPVLVGCWHGRLLMIPPAWQKVGRGDVFVLMGQNRNGELITRIVSTFNMKAIRGGSTKGGEEARRQMAEAVKNSSTSTLALTPDGPRGPRYVSKMGMASMSRALNIPVVWVTASAKWSVRFPTWDRFMFPLPFSKVIVQWSPPTFPESLADLSAEGYRDALDAIGRELLVALDTETGRLSDQERAQLEHQPIEPAA